MMKRAAKVMALLFTLMLAMSSMTFAMWSGTISQSDFQNHVKAGKFAIFVKNGSTITIYEDAKSAQIVRLGTQKKKPYSFSIIIR